MTAASKSTDQWAKRGEQVFRAAVKTAIAEHHRAGRSVVVERRGRIVEIGPSAAPIARKKASR